MAALTKTFGVRLKALRDERKVSQVAVATAAGVAQSTVSQWETGDAAPTLDHLADLAKFFGRTVPQLLSSELDEEADIETTRALVEQWASAFVRIKHQIGSVPKPGASEEGK
ncbi:MAG: helix-turn-helix domain-containing protein [Polyangiaceae bacterium]